jgi:hypothetical protein
MNWDDLRIAYAPYHKDFVVPGDRRRFVFYANERNIKFEVADPLEKYDIVYLTYGCDASAWIKYKKNNPNVKFVFELIDSYLLENNNVLTLFRGAARYLLGKESAMWLDYKVALRKMVSIADAVVCSTHAQKADMLRFNRNIHLSLDYFSNDITYRKTSLESSKIFRLVWEGQAYTVNNLLLLNDVFEILGDEFELYIITDPVIKSPFRVFDKTTISVLNKLKCKFHLMDWDKGSFSENIANADLAIIPISSDNPMMWNKPENKILLLWEIGIPTFTSATPAYKRTMDAAGLNLYCSSSDDWVRKIKDYVNSSIEHRRTLVEKANGYLLKFHNRDEILKNWDVIFNSLQINLDK